MPRTGFTRSTDKGRGRLEFTTPERAGRDQTLYLCPPDGRVVVEVEGGITVYPARRAGDRWRAVWYEGGRRRQCEAVAEDKLAVKLARVAERLAADAPGLERPGADLIAWYLNPDRHPAGRAWSRKHADTQRRLCERFVAPVIGGVTCQDIRLADMQRIVNAAPTAGEGARLRRCLSAMVTAGIAAGYLTSPRLKEVHWQAAGPGRARPAGGRRRGIGPVRRPRRDPRRS